MVIGDLVKQTQQNLEQVGMDYGIGVLIDICENVAGAPLAFVWWPKLTNGKSMRIQLSKLEALLE